MEGAGAPTDPGAEADVGAALVAPVFSRLSAQHAEDSSAADYPGAEAEPAEQEPALQDDPPAPQEAAPDPTSTQPPATEASEEAAVAELLDSMVDQVEPEAAAAGGSAAQQAASGEEAMEAPAPGDGQPLPPPAAARAEPAQQPESDALLGTEPAVEGGVAAEQRTAAEEPAAAEQPMAADEPAAAEQPMAAEEPAAAHEPIAAEEPAAAHEPIAAEEPAAAHEPMTANDATVEGPAASEASAAAGADEQPAAQEAAVDGPMAAASDEAAATADPAAAPPAAAQPAEMPAAPAADHAVAAAEPPTVDSAAAEDPVAAAAGDPAGEADAGPAHAEASAIEAAADEPASPSEAGAAEATAAEASAETAVPAAAVEAAVEGDPVAEAGADGVAAQVAVTAQQPEMEEGGSEAAEPVEEEQPAVEGPQLVEEEGDAVVPPAGAAEAEAQLVAPAVETECSAEAGTAAVEEGAEGQQQPAEEVEGAEVALPMPEAEEPALEAEPVAAAEQVEGSMAEVAAALGEAPMEQHGQPGAEAMPPPEQEAVGGGSRVGQTTSAFMEGGLAAISEVRCADGRCAEDREWLLAGVTAACAHLQQQQADGLDLHFLANSAPSLAPQPPRFLQESYSQLLQREVSAKLMQVLSEQQLAAATEQEQGQNSEEPSPAAELPVQSSPGSGMAVPPAALVLPAGSPLVTSAGAELPGFAEPLLKWSPVAKKGSPQSRRMQPAVAATQGATQLGSPPAAPSPTHSRRMAPLHGPPSPTAGPGSRPAAGSAGRPQPGSHMAPLSHTAPEAAGPSAEAGSRMRRFSKPSMSEILAAVGTKSRPAKHAGSRGGSLPASRGGSAGWAPTHLRTAPPPVAPHMPPIQLAGAGLPPAAFPPLPPGAGPAGSGALLNWGRPSMAAPPMPATGGWFVPAPAGFGAASGQPAQLPMYAAAGQQPEQLAVAGGVEAPAEGSALPTSDGGVAEAPGPEPNAAPADLSAEAGASSSAAPASAGPAEVPGDSTGGQEVFEEQAHPYAAFSTATAAGPQQDVSVAASWPPYEGAKLPPLFEVGHCMLHFGGRPYSSPPAALHLPLQCKLSSYLPCWCLLTSLRLSLLPAGPAGGRCRPHPSHPLGGQLQRGSWPPQLSGAWLGRQPLAARWPARSPGLPAAACGTWWLLHACPSAGAWHLGRPTDGHASTVGHASWRPRHALCCPAAPGAARHCTWASTRPAGPRPIPGTGADCWAAAGTVPPAAAGAAGPAGLHVAGPATADAVLPAGAGADGSSEGTGRGSGPARR